jgi:hypothetical protein
VVPDGAAKEERMVMLVLVLALRNSDMCVLWPFGHAGMKSWKKKYVQCFRQ